MRNVIEDLSLITTIPTSNLYNLSSKILWCIGDSVKDSLLDNNDLTEINVGIGRLIIKVEEDQIRYRFIPSKELDNSLKEVIGSKANPLEKAVENSLVDRIIKTYKDLF